MPRRISERILRSLLRGSEIVLGFMKVKLFCPPVRNLGGFLGEVYNICFSGLLAI